MGDQGNLFSMPVTKSAEPGRKETIQAPRRFRRYDTKATTITIKEPFGKKDKRGRYFFERFFERVKALPEADRDVLHHIILDTPADRMIEIRKLLNTWVSASHAERGDYELSDRR